jgi:tryptophan synthase alpha chain
MADAKAVSDPGRAGRSAEDVPGRGVRRIEAAFTAARQEGRAALMPYMMGGFPGLDDSLAIARAYADAGADLVEVGVPFSDPLADGPVIHAAATAALERGAALEDALAASEALGEGTPSVAMIYVNMVLALGPRRFAGRLAAAGAAGAIVPDLPLEEAGEIRAALDEHGLALVPLVAPTTPPERRRRICDSARGFVYVVSDVGVTGERDDLPERLAELVRSVQHEAEVPVAVGFGIGTPEQAAAVGSVADGVIIGSRLVRAAQEGGAEEVGAFLREVRSALG